MSRTVIDLDDEALEAAAKELGTTTKRDTINTALREVVARNERLRALSELQEIAAEGGLDLDILLDKRKYRGTAASRDDATDLRHDDDPRHDDADPDPDLRRSA